MTSPTTLTGLPCSVLPLIDEAIVVVLQGWAPAGSLPTSAAGSSKVPFVGLEKSGKSFPCPPARASELSTSSAEAPPIANVFFGLDIVGSSVGVIRNRRDR